jgi:adenylosuccinate synthase
VTSVIGNGVVVYPPRFLEEVEKLRAAGVPVGANLVVSDRAHVIFPYHMEEERLLEAGAEGKIGTTGRGIGPCYQDKVGRRFAIRIGDLLDANHLRERLRFIVPFKNKILAAMGDAKSFDADALCDEYLGYAALMKSHIADTTRLLHERIAAGKPILFEAAQGSLLDVDHGSYPYVTSSSSLPSGIWTGTGVPSRKITRIIGIAKAYTSRVGRGPFPTELDNELGERIRKVGREYGTVTGRPRRCGWFDAVAVRYTATLADADEISLMLLDVLSGLPQLQIANTYLLDGQRIDHFPSDAATLARCTPVYETLPGWSEDITAARKASDLPAAARKYIDRIAAILGKPISIASVGPDRDQTIHLQQ